MDHRWAARGLVVGLHIALLAMLWQHQSTRQHAPATQRLTVRIVTPRPAPPPSIVPRLTPPRVAPPALPAIVPPFFSTDSSPTAPAPPVPSASPPEVVATPTEPPRSTLRLMLPPGYAASTAAARNPALSDPRTNTPRRTLEDRIADATGGAGAWVEESTSENRSLVVGALGDRRTVMRRGDTCVEVFRSRIADQDPFNGNVAPRTVGMLGKPYRCK